MLYRFVDLEHLDHRLRYSEDGIHLTAESYCRRVDALSRDILELSDGASLLVWVGDSWSVLHKCAVDDLLEAVGRQLDTSKAIGLPAEKATSAAILEAIGASSLDLKDALVWLSLGYGDWADLESTPAAKAKGECLVRYELGSRGVRAVLHPSYNLNVGPIEPQLAWR